MAISLQFPMTIGEYRILEGKALTGDASARRYWRVDLESQSHAVLCCYPGGAGIELDRDLEVLSWLADRQLPVPRVLACEHGDRRVLLEDLGPSDGETTLARLPTAQRPWFALRFVDPIAVLSSMQPAALPNWNRPLEYDLLRWELSGFELWSLQYRLGAAPSPPITRALDALAEVVSHHPKRICFRDYHLNNLLVDLRGNVRVIDVQDVLVGPDTYDLASLLGDRAMPSLIASPGQLQIARHWAAATQAPEGWQERLLQTGLHRALKVLGTFSRLEARGVGAFGRWIPGQATVAADYAEKLHSAPELSSFLLDLVFSGGCDVR